MLLPRLTELECLKLQIKTNTERQLHGKMYNIKKVHRNKVKEK